MHIELALLKMCYLTSALQLTQQSFSAEGKKNSFNEQAHAISVKKSAATTQKSNEPVAEQPVSNVRQANDYASKVSPSSGIGIVAEKNIQPEYSDKILNKSESEIINIGNALSRKVNTSLLGSVSLSDLDIEEDEDESSLKETVSAPVVTNLRENELLAAWDDYEKLTEAEKRVSIQSLLKNNRPAVEGMVVTVNLQSRLQKELFDNERMRLLEFLESKLKVSGISLMAVVDKTNPNPTFKPFTAAEKLNKMTQENPAILELQRKLDLKLEH